jgi:hypothetical protein
LAAFLAQCDTELGRGLSDRVFHAPTAAAAELSAPELAAAAARWRFTWIRARPALALPREAVAQVADDELGAADHLI